MSRRHHQHHRHQVHGPVFHYAQAQAEQQDVKRQVATLVSVVYKTASPTFDGPVGGYTTIIPSIHTPTFPPTSTPVQNTQAIESTTQQQSSLAIPTTIAQVSTPAVVSASAIAASLSSLLISPSVNSIPTPSSIAASVSNPSSLLLLTSIQATSPTLVSSPTLSPMPTLVPTAILSSASQVSSSEPAPISSQVSKGLAGGAKAGIAIAVILGLAGVLGLIAFCCLQRKKKQREARDRFADEKNPFGDNAASPTPLRTSVPLQASLDPATQHRPQITACANNNAALVSGEGHGATARQDAERGTIDLPNPFEQSESAPALDPTMLSRQEVPAPLRIRTPTPDVVTDAGLLAGASATLAQRHNAPKPLDIKRAPSPSPAAPSPSGTEFSTTSMSQGSLANSRSSNDVHRIQLDFKPSMEDELELCAGQLIRLLHEYDDGWALCIRLDRSQQGVAPRSCLSTRPVKPRVKQPSLDPSSSRMHSPHQQRRSPPPSKLGSSIVLQRNQGSESPTPAPLGTKSTSTRPDNEDPRRENHPQTAENARIKSIDDPQETSTSDSNVGITDIDVQGIQKTALKNQATLPPILQPPSPPRAMQRKPVPGQAD